MAADLGGSQISALLESVPGIRNVLRSPVADALVNMVRAAARAGEVDGQDPSVRQSVNRLSSISYRAVGRKHPA